MSYLISLAYCNSPSVSLPGLVVLNLGGRMMVHVNSGNEQLFLDPSPHIKSVILTMALCVLHV